MNMISSPHEKRYRKGASLSPSEFLYLHRHIFSRVYCTVTGGDSLGTRTPPHSARGTQSGGPWDQWVLGYPSVWDGVGKGSGPSGGRAGPQELVAGHRGASVPLQAGVWDPLKALLQRGRPAHPCKEQGCERSPGTALSRSSAPPAGFNSGWQTLAVPLELDPEGPAQGPGKGT